MLYDRMTHLSYLTLKKKNEFQIEVIAWRVFPYFPIVCACIMFYYRYLLYEYNVKILYKILVHPSAYCTL